MDNTITLSWKDFSVNVDKANAYFKANLSSNYDGLVCSESCMLVCFISLIEQTDADAVASYWDNATIETFQPTPQEIATLQLQQRMDWGQNVIMQFRVFSLGIPDTQGVAMLANMMDVKMTLELGMLQAAADLLGSKDPDDVLDAQFDETRTVRQRFIEMILTEGPTP